MVRILYAVALTLALCASVAAADVHVIGGPVRVIDADTVVIADERVRLQGIDAPEQRQRCERADGTRYRYGRAATQALKAKIGDGAVTCKLEPDRDRYGRALGVCFGPDGDNLNGWLVAEGYALAYRRYSTRYVGQEDAARAAGRGLWAGKFVPPWHWRRGDRLPVAE